MTTLRFSFPAADPFILRASNGLYYLYCTHEDGSGFPVRSSHDLVTWTDHGLALSASHARWGTAVSGRRSAMRSAAGITCLQRRLGL